MDSSSSKQASILTTWVMPLLYISLTHARVVLQTLKSRYLAFRYGSAK